MKEKEIPLAIASSSSMKIIEAVVKKLSIADYFTIIHSAEFEEYGKPHPQVFLSTANKLSVAPENCIVFEDSKHGMIAALSAKMKVVIVPDSESLHSEWTHCATSKLNSLSEFDLASYI